jgi:hypothetical protein
MTNAPNKITRPQIEDALQRSGYLLECRVENSLLARGYSVMVNGIYPDPDTGKSREMDVAAGKLLELKGKSDSLLGDVNANIIIECINNSQPIALFTKENFCIYGNWAIKASGSPSEIYH